MNKQLAVQRAKKMSGTQKKKIKKVEPEENKEAKEEKQDANACPKKMTKVTTGWISTDTYYVIKKEQMTILQSGKTGNNEALLFRCNEANLQFAAGYCIQTSADLDCPAYLASKSKHTVSRRRVKDLGPHPVCVYIKNCPGVKKGDVDTYYAKQLLMQLEGAVAPRERKNAQYSAHYIGAGADYDYNLDVGADINGFDAYGYDQNGEGLAHQNAPSLLGRDSDPYSVMITVAALVFIGLCCCLLCLLTHSGAVMTGYFLSNCRRSRKKKEATHYQSDLQNDEEI